MSIATTTEPKSAAKLSGQSNKGENQGCGLYVYCIIDCDHPESFGQIGVGEDQPEVFVIEHEGVGAVVSATPCDKYDISRDNVLAHQRVMETIMQQGHTVLPIRFNTIADGNDSKSAQRRVEENVLIDRLDEFSSLLATMRCRVELGVKALWSDMKSVFTEIAESDERIRQLREKLLAALQAPPARRPRNLMHAQVKLGEMVKEALEAKKLEAEEKLTAILKPFTADLKKNKPFGDAMFANLAILVEKSWQADITSALSSLETEQAGKVKLRCVGPVPPSNFIELVITWDD